MATQPHSTPKPRVRQSRERVLRVAIQIADKNGIEALTMRNLAERLGLEAMTLYHYVANKDDILNHIVDLVVNEFEVPSDKGTWQAALRRSATSAYEVLLRHPWACGLMMSPARIGPARLAYMESLLGRLRGAGFSAETTHHAYHALGIKELPDSGATFRRQISFEDYPYLVEHMGEHNKPSKGGGEFGFGLDLIFDGLEEIRLRSARARTDMPRVKRRPRPSC